MKPKLKAAWAREAAKANKESGLDSTNTEPCGAGHFCCFMQAALDGFGGLKLIYSLTSGEASVAFSRKARGRRLPFLVLNVCPWCKESLDSRRAPTTPARERKEGKRTAAVEKKKR